MIDKKLPNMKANNDKGGFMMRLWFFMLIVNLIIPVSMVVLGKYFTKKAPKKNKLHIRIPDFYVYEEPRYMGFCASLFWKYMV